MASHIIVCKVNVMQQKKAYHSSKFNAHCLLGCQKTDTHTQTDTVSISSTKFAKIAYDFANKNKIGKDWKGFQPINASGNPLNSELQFFSSRNKVLTK